MLSQSLIIFVAKVLGYGIRIILPVFLVRLMTKAEIGAYNQFFLVEALLMTLFQMGVNQSQYYFVPRDPKNAGGYFLNSISLNVGIFAIGYTCVGLFRPEISSFLGISILDEFFWQIALFSMMMMLNITCNTYLTARKKFKQAAFFEINMQVLASIATLSAAYLTRDLKTIFTALVVARVLSFLMVGGFIVLRDQGLQSERYFMDAWKQVRYGVVLALGGVVWTLVLRMHELTVNKFYDLETYAVYAQGLKRIPILQFYSQSIAAVALVQFAHLVKEDDWEGVKKFWDKIIASTFGIGVPVTLALILIANPLIILMYTREYAGAVIIFQINTIAMLYHLLNPTLVLRALDRNDITLKVNIGLILALPPALYAGIQLYGLVGAISVHTLFVIGGRVISHFVLNRLTPVKLRYLPAPSDVLSFYRESADWASAKIKRALNR
jgi:O-antigen/teichoic acid export membrane protein